jgi:cation diffusion facilitator CzcD-associated flavoprotein CzcO
VLAVRALVIGAGVAGIVAAVRLGEQGADVVVVEKADRLGGTWRENTYPGIACDVPSHLYSYTFAPSPGWSRTFAPGHEIQAYLERVAAETGVADRIRYGVEVDSLTWDGRTWHATSTRGDEFEAEVVVAATGVLHHPRYPDIEGLDDFAGPCFHSARWDHSVDLSGTRLGVVGTGSSAVQIVGAVVDEVAELRLFQRTAQWVMPMPNREFGEDERAALAADPAKLAERRAYYEERFGGAFSDVVVDASSPMLDVMEDLCRANLEENVADPEKREKLRPDYRVACKRLVLAPGFYQAVSKPNVEVVVERIARAVPAGLQTVDGTVHELDVLVLATGFDAVTGGLTSLQLRGATGETLGEHWRDGVRTQLGLACSGFPNLLFLYGPQSPSGFCNGPTCAEVQGDWVIALLEHLGQHGITRFEASAEAEAAWREQVQAIAGLTLFPRADSWYMGANIPGKRREMLNWPGGLQLYLAACRESAAAGYQGFVLGSHR